MTIKLEEAVAKHKGSVCDFAQVSKFSYFKAAIAAYEKVKRENHE